MKQACAIITCFVAVCNAIAGPDTAKQILDTTGVKGGLIVHLGCGDGKFTAALYKRNGFVVQGLDTDPRNVDAARKHIQSLGIYGKVSADLFDGKQLPYVDDCVNLIVASGRTGVTREEMLRVLAPGGVALVGGKEITKPRPETIDDWTHFMHGADNNAVAEDTVIDMPYRIRWVGDPKHSRSHHFHSSISTMVSAGGRLFTIIDEGPTYLFNQTPARWSLVARDAFNGVTLWRVPITSWVPVHQGGGGHDGRFMFAPDLFRRLVAIDDRVYTTLSIFGPISELDAATGETIRTYAGTEKTEEIIYHNGVLYCVQATEDPANIDRRAMGGYIEKPIQKRIAAIHAVTGRQLWSVEGKDAFGYQSLTLIAKGNRVLFQNTEAILCLDAKTGKELWRHEQRSVLKRTAYTPPTLLISADVVLSADRQATKSLSVKDGSVGTSESEPSSADDWPTYRHDGQRSGRASTQVKSALSQQWSTKLGGNLSTLVSADGRLYVAQKDTHAVICLDAKNGKELWRFTAGGRVDSPPTIARGIAVFGCSDGFVHALRASDGVLVWKFQAALGDRRLVARDQIESVWPLHGSTLVEDGAVYVASGRNAYFDQGVCLYKLGLATGKPLLAKRYYGRDPETGRRVDLFTLPTMEGQSRPRMTGLKADVFSAGANSLFLGGVAVTRDLKLIGDGEPHLFSHMQLLAAESFERSCWIYGTYLDTGKMGFPIGPGGEIGGVIMAFDDASVYGANDPSSMIGQGVYSAVKVLEPVQVEISSRALKRKAIKANQKWRKEDVPVNVRALVVSDDLLFVAGPERFDERAVEQKLNRIPTSELELDPLLADALDTALGRKGSMIWVMNKADGEKRHSLKLDSAPVFDGMIAANKCLYLSTLDGRVIFLGADR